jgi:hypothetical protein
VTEDDFNREVMCTDKDGIMNLFKYALKESEDDGRAVWVFYVLPHDLKAPDFFEFAITMVGVNLGKVTMMKNRDLKEYVGKGITERMIEEASTVLDIQICSSTNNPDKKVFKTEWRTEPATKIWERLRVRGRATYSVEDDIYTYIRN